MTQQELEALINGMAGNSAAAKAATMTADEQLKRNQAAVTETEGKRIKGIAKKLCAAHVATLHNEQGLTFHLLVQCCYFLLNHFVYFLYLSSV